MAREIEYVGLLLGDLHVGSKYAPCPAEFETSYDSIHRPNVGQEYLNECFAHMVEERLPKLDFLSLGGDIIDGPQPKSSGAYIWEPDSQFQARAAKQLLEPVLGKLKRSAPVFVAEGSKYHDGVVREWAEWLGEQVDGVREGPHYAAAWRIFEVDGIPLDVAHRNSHYTRYKSTPLDREIGFAIERCHEAGEVTPYAIIRHHSHGPFDTVGRMLRVACECPPWQMQSNFAQTSISPNRYYSPYLGSVLVHIYPERLAQYRRPVVFEGILYPHPKRARHQIGGRGK